MSSESGQGPRNPAKFATTRWSLVREAAGEDTEARKALATLAQLYWFPLYAFARREGAAPEAAEDLVQGFFASFLEGGHVRTVDPDRGRFRSWLLGAFKHHHAHQRERDGAQKRGGDRIVIALDVRSAESRLASEPSHEETSDRAFERAWAHTLLDRTRGLLREEWTSRDMGPLYERLGPHLGAPGEATSHREAAEALGMTEVAVKVALHRLRQRFRRLLREEVAATVDADADIDAEISALISAL